MSSSLIRGKYIIGRIIDNDRAKVIEDGAIFQRDGKIVEIGTEEDLSDRHQPDEVLGDGSHVVVPGFVNSHHHVGVTPFQLGCPDLPLEPLAEAAGTIGYELLCRVGSRVPRLID